MYLSIWSVIMYRKLIYVFAWTKNPTICNEFYSITRDWTIIQQVRIVYLCEPRNASVHKVVIDVCKMIILHFKVYYNIGSYSRNTNKPYYG